MAGLIHAWEKVTSTMVSAISFVDTNSGSIAVRFNDGKEIAYPETTEDQYFEFMAAASKGLWLRRNLMDLNYVSIETT